MRCLRRRRRGEEEERECVYARPVCSTLRKTLAAADEGSRFQLCYIYTNNFLSFLRLKIYVNRKIRNGNRIDIEGNFFLLLFFVFSFISSFDVEVVPRYLTICLEPMRTES
jgi:hypothetical protein